MHTPMSPQIYPNMTLEEITALTSLPDRALALTFAQIDPLNLWWCDLIRSVDVPETGELGATLQRHLLPKSALGRHRNSIREQMLKEMLAAQRQALLISLAQGGASAPAEKAK